MVTGAAQGLGQAMAIGLAEAGAATALIDIKDCSRTKNDMDGLSESFNYDLLQCTQVNALSLIDEIVNKMGRLDIIVNNAGIIRREAAANYRETDWQDVLKINLEVVFYLCQAAARYFMEKGEGGKIINLASMLSFQGGHLVPSYVAAKSAVAGLTKALANEWAAHGIQVNALAPGYFQTEVTRGIYEDPLRNRRVLSRIPAGRWGEPVDLKGAVVFLASQASNYLNGTIMPVDGGWLGR